MRAYLARTLIVEMITAAVEMNMGADDFQNDPLERDAMLGST